MAGINPSPLQPILDSDHRLPEVAYLELRDVRDDLQYFAQLTVAKRNGNITLSRNGLAHCFDHLADRLSRVLCACKELSMMAGMDAVDSRLSKILTRCGRWW